eukprot:CAMPEP_0177422752 /NCGR_PEP_ID=MMETSP0368-20130122/71510_1 /TAXON_ID=447022 ORGANISM="Scrippsiella hangoei-like, Strain SHHI-4" /NCGR_SAMPLE_ID=MMETSP0368 /ASSEMBLY_ACC=CAM_ASM_000363 /LENGTH=77 /DNA_ID=CAMNT_0018892739 /DNA_START=59 /DNA_END=289 /DNA_ORIENTATION=+
MVYERPSVGKLSAICLRPQPSMNGGPRRRNREGQPSMATTISTTMLLEASVHRSSSGVQVPPTSNDMYAPVIVAAPV